MLECLVEGAVSARCQPISETGQSDFLALVKAVDKRHASVWICNPNNPTGTYESVEDMQLGRQLCSRKLLVIIDEAYIIDFITQKNAVAELQVPREFE